MPELDQINSNLRDLSRDMGAFHQETDRYHEALSREVEQDLSDLGATLAKIQQCREGICALAWKPTR